MQDQYCHLYLALDLVPRLYESQKVHKEDPMLHPFVDSTGSRAYNTSRAIADLLKSLMGKTIPCQEHDYLQQRFGTKHLDEMIRNSHDVASLFTDLTILDGQ